LGSALILTASLMALALITLGGILAWSATSIRLTYRSNQYSSTVMAAEATTEKVLSRIVQDFQTGGEKLVSDNLNSYRQTVLTAADAPYWSGWEFNDACGNVGRTFVQPGDVTNYVVLNSTYAGLQGFVHTFTLVSDARQKPALQDVVAGVYVQAELASIPVFQFAMYSSGDMEISCGQPFTITGRVHSNGKLYVEPDNVLTFQTDVTAVDDILFQRAPLDNRQPPSGSVIYQGHQSSHVSAMNLPIGTDNSPEAVRQIIEPPPPAEDPNSPLGRVRYFNEADMLLIVTNRGTGVLVSATSGRFDNFATSVPTNQLATFVTTTNTFWDARENKNIQPIDINVGGLASWSATNSSVRAALGGKDVATLYVWDQRTLNANNLGAVRLTKGTRLPARGLTVATADPLYILGNYNQTNAAFLGTSDISGTLPASLAADAITILSPNWSDANSRGAMSSRKAAPTTVNAAFLAGEVDTSPGKYSGGMENFPRFLETWGSANAFTYNGSMVKMFPSRYATSPWGTGNVYDPPKRNWTYNVNFESAMRLPPRTPCVQRLIRCRWATLAPNQIAPPSSP
jgi:hypothetical protein